MVEPLTISGIVGAIGALALAAVNTFLSFLKRFGFWGYWLVLLGVLYGDMTNSIFVLNLLPFKDPAGAGNIIGSMFTVIPFIPKFFTTTFLFALTLVSGVVVVLWKSKAGIIPSASA